MKKILLYCAIVCLSLSIQAQTLNDFNHTLTGASDVLQSPVTEYMSAVDLVPLIQTTHTTTLPHSIEPLTNCSVGMHGVMISLIV